MQGGILERQAFNDTREALGRFFESDAELVALAVAYPARQGPARCQPGR